MSGEVLNFIQLIANVLILPIGGMLWSMQGRLSRIEGRLENQGMKRV